MKYPNLPEVEQADHKQLARWHRFLDSPGKSILYPNTSTGVTENIMETINRERQVMNRIEERLNSLGGITSEISKTIGWDE